jgi:molybdenum cofactor cytidylyltransferase
MELARALRLAPARTSKGLVGTIAFTGAGGKTTAMFQLARQLVDLRRSPVIVTASTHLGAWQIPLADKHIVLADAGQLALPSHPGILLFTGPLDQDRTLPIAPDLLQVLHGLCTANDFPLLIEADGSRQKPLKAPGEGEPAIPAFVDTVIVVAGLSGLGQPLSAAAVHRPEIFADLAAISEGSTITVEALARVLANPRGGLKNIPPTARRIALLNQADTPELQAAAGRLARSLLPAYEAVLAGSLTAGIFHTFESTAAIILAAGESRRLGKPKQLLEWRGRPFVRAVAQTALAAGLDPVIVVTGAYDEPVQRSLADLSLKIVNNSGWQEGQASSIRAGVSALRMHPQPASLHRPPGSAIFLLVDQPQVDVSILKALVDAHGAELAAIVAPLVQEQRANPVLFDRDTFDDLLDLQGEIGGRGIFHKHRVQYLPWHDERLLVDVDTPEAYQRLSQDEGK